MPDPGRKPTVSDDDILAVFLNSRDPVLTTKEVSERIEIGHRGTYDRLSKLATDGPLKTKKVGDSGAVWWYPAAIQNRYPDDGE
jgi:hypothetical protein